MIKERIFAILVVMGIESSALAVQISYIDWTSSGTQIARGAITLSSSAIIGVTYVGELAFAQTTGGFNYWSYSSKPPYNNAGFDAYTGVPNMPTTSDIIALSSAVTTPNTITFSSPVKDPVMLILSEGRPNLPVYYNFDQDFVILSSGNGYWGGNPSGSLLEEAGGVLKGVKGHGTIQFLGTITSISWTVQSNENWYGFTIGVPEPQGVPDGGLTIMFLGTALSALGIVRKIRRRRIAAEIPATRRMGCISGT